MMYLVEGGNIWPDTVHFDPNQVTKLLTAETEKYLTDTGLKLFVIGSGFSPRYTANGDVVESGDLDVLADMKVLLAAFKTNDPKVARKSLAEYLQQKGIKTYQAGTTVHTRIPLGQNFYQVDIKIVPNAAQVAEYHRHDLPKGSPYKGVNKQMMMNSLASSQRMLWSPDEGLYARDANGKKANLLATDLNQIAKLLLGQTADKSDLGSVESILKAIPDEQRRAEIFNMAKSSSSWQAATPNVNEWFRRTMDILK
jgi:hypothetical protein